MELIDKRSINRAIKSFRCFPLNCTFYDHVQKDGLNAEQVFHHQSQFQVDGSQWFKHSSAVEEAFRWLIIVGVLRREVDGQGLTSKVRLTPLGRKVLRKEPDLPIQNATFSERISNWLVRTWPLR